MMNGVKRAHRRADCAVLGAIALVAVSGVSAHQYNLYTDELRARASLPDFVAITDSPVKLARDEQAAQSECLAEVVYYEARGEGIEGEKAVAEVVLQRTRDGNYPSTVCGVVYDGIQPARRDCQFSFACDGSLNRPKDPLAWRHARALAQDILAGSVKLTGATGHAIAYHSVDVAPGWAFTMLETAQIGNHVFYRRDPYAQARLAGAETELPLLSPSDIDPPPPMIRVEAIRPSKEVQPQVEASGAVGNGA